MHRLAPCTGDHAVKRTELASRNCCQDDLVEAVPCIRPLALARAPRRMKSAEHRG